MADFDSFAAVQDDDGLDSPINQDPQLLATCATAVPATTSVADPSLYNPDSNWIGFPDGLPADPASFGDVYNNAAFTFPQSWSNAPPAQFLGQTTQASSPQQLLSDISPTSLHAEPMSNPSIATASLMNAHRMPNPTGQVVNTLTPAQQEKLKSIAMPAHARYRSPRSDMSPRSSMGDPKDASSSPEGMDHSKMGRKRKQSADDDEDDDDDDDNQQPVKKTAHNMIEKRYRTNLNDKIAALRDSVPSLRIMSKSARGEDTTEDREELHGLTPAHKLNKATVLSKATEYIRHLEKRNMRLMDENNAMQQRINAFEKLFMNGALTQPSPVSPSQQPPTPIQYPQDAAAYMAAGGLPTPGASDPPGMIHVPDAMKRILEAQAATGRPYPVPPQPFHVNPAMVRQQLIQQQQQQIQQNRWQNAGPYFGKLMVGSLAGLMILEAVRENEQSNETPGGRGLFAMPLELLGSIVPGSHFSVAGYQFSAAQVISNLKLLVLFGALLWACVPSLFAPKAPKPEKTRIDTALEAVPSLASPIHVRRQAWLTAIQTVWVPQHNFILEAAALILKTMKLSLRNTIGIHGYQMLTGLTEDQETARVKAWTIALDAQLAGGDVEVNGSRLTLTLLASWTLPDTPLRLMLKALHIRVLTRQRGTNPLFNFIATEWAKANWNAARQLKNMNTQLRRNGGELSDEDLPDHLTLLLEQNCEDVLQDGIVQRAHNLAWNRSTTHNIATDIEGMNAVVEDPAVRSPMDAVAAWWSSMILHRVLVNSHKDNKEGDNPAPTLNEEIELAAKIAPIGSNAQLRAVAIRAVLVDDKRGSNIAAALQAFSPSVNPDRHPDYSRGVPPLIDAPLSRIIPDKDVAVVLECAKGIAHLQRFSLPPVEVLAAVNNILPRVTSGLSLLGCTALFKFMNCLQSHPTAAEACAILLERVSGCLRICIGSSTGDTYGLDQVTRHQMVDRCITITKSIVGMEGDSAYGSMSDCDAEDGGC